MKALRKGSGFGYTYAHTSGAGHIFVFSKGCGYIGGFGGREGFALSSGNGFGDGQNCYPDKVTLK